MSSEDDSNQPCTKVDILWNDIIFLHKMDNQKLQSIMEVLHHDKLGEGPVLDPHGIGIPEVM